MVQRSSNWTLTPDAHPRFRNSSRNTRARLRVGVARRKWHQHANAPHALALLRAPRAAM
jgi:hypothetical protein